MIPNSVSALKARRRAKTPVLPPELWLVVFDHATYVPGIFIPEIYEHSDTLGYDFNRYHHPLIRCALVTKRYLVRVCKQWWHLAMPFLYKSIFIGRGRCLSSLASALALSADGKGALQGERPMGSYTERLDIAIRDTRNAYLDGDLDLLAKVIRHLQNLTVVSFSVSSSREFSRSEKCDAVMDVLTCFAPALKIIDWAVPCLLPRPQSLQILANAKQLQILHCSSDSIWIDQMGTCALPSCMTVVVSPDYAWHQLSSIQLPFLRELIYDGRYEDSHGSLSQFMEKHGKRLTSVHLFWSGAATFRSQIDILASHCPKLRRLILMLDDWRLFDDKALEFMPIERLHLGCRRTQSPTKSYKMVFAALTRLKDTKPTLRIVRFMNSLNVEELLRNHRKALLPALELFNGRNLRLEDYEGRPLSARVVLCTV